MDTMASSINKQFGWTAVEADHVTYEWKIEHFKLLPEENGECIHSPIFRVKVNDGVTWRLQFYPKGFKDEIDQVSLFLELHSRNSESDKIKVNCELSILTSETIKYKSSFERTYEKMTSFGWKKMLTRSVLLNSLSLDGSIIVRCKLDISQRTITKEVHPLSFDTQKGQMTEHFSKLFDTPRLSDVTIVVRREKFPAHKVVLAARSTVFAAMFEHQDMYGNRKNEVKIEDMGPATVTGMLEFLYTDKVTDLKSLAPQLLRASDKYELERLKMMCEEVLYGSLTNDNAAEIFVLSNLYRTPKLKEYVMAFITDHLFSVTQTESYKSMVQEYPALVNELLCAMAARNAAKA